MYSAAALAEGARVSEAALDCGYQSPSAYIAAFRRQFGVTPGQLTKAVLFTRRDRRTFTPDRSRSTFDAFRRSDSLHTQE